MMREGGLKQRVPRLSKRLATSLAFNGKFGPSRYSRPAQMSRLTSLELLPANPFQHLQTRAV